jgi:hypothetical protein
MGGRAQAGVVGGTSGSGAGGPEEGDPEEQAAAEVHYFETTQERMGYAEFWAQGYSIGSGTVESACKGVMGARLKQAGMCWTQAGAQAVLSLQPSCSAVVGRRFGPLPAPNSKAA